MVMEGRGAAFRKSCRVRRPTSVPWWATTWPGCRRFRSSRAGSARLETTMGTHEGGCPSGESVVAGAATEAGCAPTCPDGLGGDGLTWFAAVGLVRAAPAWTIAAVPPLVVVRPSRSFSLGMLLVLWLRAGALGLGHRRRHRGRGGGLGRQFHRGRGGCCGYLLLGFGPLAVWKCLLGFTCPAPATPPATPAPSGSCIFFGGGLCGHRFTAKSG